MRIISWNVNGIRAAWGHGLSRFLEENDADIYMFQETKTAEEVPIVEMEDCEAYWSFCTQKKGYSGTLTLTKWKPLEVRYDIGAGDFDTEGRIITLEFDEFFVVNCYVPNAQHSPERAEYRSRWDRCLLAYLKNLRDQKPVIVGGDFNVPISDRDVYEENQRVEWEHYGFQSEEREGLLEIIKAGYIDSYRLCHPEERKYSWWSNRRMKRIENRGWRLDYFLVSDELAGYVRESTMYTEVLGSDHCPIGLELELLLKDSVKKQHCTRYSYLDLIHMENNSEYYWKIRHMDMTRLWNSVDWDAAEEHLQTMQMALAKSAYTRNYDLIEKWQKKIVFSLDAKLLAVRYVCSSAVSHGVDGIKWTTPHEKMSAALLLGARDYHAMPSRLIMVNSKNRKERRIHLDTYYDRAMQCLYAYSLDPIAESWGERKSFAYRKGRSAYDANEYVKRTLSGENAPEWVFIADVRQCYESISHEWILQNIPMAENVLLEFLKAGYVFCGELFPSNAGVGIGCTISPIIANMTLDGLSDHIYKNLYHWEEIDYQNGELVRYADDILVFVRSRETGEEIKQYVADFLAERGLELSEEKSRIVHVEEGFDFLSRNYQKRGSQIYVKPAEKAVERFMGELKEAVENFTGSQKTLIRKLNRKIDGWITYHKVTDAEAAFRRLDVYVTALLLKLCEKKHPKWTRERILQKYWYQLPDGRYCYALPDKKEFRVKFLSDALLIQYHAAKTNVNPYIDLEYLEQRTQERSIRNVTGCYRSIWNRQEGRCYYCGRKILRDEEKTLVEADAGRRKMVARMAYIHKRCLLSSLEYIETESPPASLTDLRGLLEQLGDTQKPVARKYLGLSEYFRTCDKNSVTLTFAQIGELMGEELGAAAQRKEYWYRTGFGNVSQCWLANGYEIKNLHLEGKQRVVFHLAETSKNTGSVKIPEAVLYHRIPNEAKYELENFFAYIVKKYAL